MQPANETAPRLAPRRRRRAVSGALGLLMGLLATNAHGARRDHVFHALDADAAAQRQVVAIRQDPMGFVWIASDSELRRYNGQHFRSFRHDPDNPKSLPSGRLTALAIGPDHSLYVGSSTRFVYRLDLTTATFLPLAPDATTRSGQPGERVRDLLYQEGRGLWVGTDSGIDLIDPAADTRQAVLRFGVAASAGARRVRLIWNGGRLLHAATDEGLYQIDTASRVASRISGLDTADSVAFDSAGQLWIGSVGRLFVLPADSPVPRALPQPMFDDGRSVRALVADPLGRVWFAAGEDLFRLDTTGRVKQLPQQTGRAGGLPSAPVSNLFIDRAGLLWVAVEGHGVFNADSRGNTIQQIFDPSVPAASGHDVLALAEDPQDGIWIGSSQSGLLHYDIDQDRFEPGLGRAEPGTTPLAGKLAVLDIARGAEGRWWLATNRGLIERLPSGSYRRHALDGDNALSLTRIEQARDGRLWVGTQDAGLLLFNPVMQQVERRWRSGSDDLRSLGSDHINDLHLDAAQRLWIATENGLNLLLPGQEAVRQFRHASNDPATPSGDVVLSISETDDGSLWVGTQNGLDRLTRTDDPDAPIIERVRHPSLDLHPGVTAVMEDRRGRLWLSTRNGLLRLDLQGDSSHEYLSGMQGLTFNPGAALQLDDGRLLFGTTNGVSLIEADGGDSREFNAPVVLLSAFAGSQRTAITPLIPPERIEFQQAGGVLHLGFTALDFNPVERLRFRYRLDGVDRDWVMAGDRSFAIYSGLSPGDYVFHAEAGDSDGRWSTQALRLPVHISPGIWNSVWAYLLYLTVAGGLLIWYLQSQQQRRQRRLDLLNQIREREERLKLALWGSGDEFWDWDLRRNSLCRIGADQLLGDKAEQHLSTDDWRARAVHPEDLPKVQQRIQAHILGQAEFYESEHRVMNAEGNYIWVRSRGKVVARDEDGNPLRIAGTAADVSHTRRAERERRIATEVLRSMSEAVAVFDERFNFVSVNPAFSRITGYEANEVIGQNTSLLDSSQHDEEFYQRTRELLTQSGHWKGEMWQRRKDGEEFLGWLELNEVRDSQHERTHFVAVVNDVTDKKRAEQELRYLANYDTLTGLPNRTLLSERLARAVVRARRQDARVAVLFLDLDRFKDVNDSLGHAAGDRILKAAAARLLTTVRETDTVARLGGDEFTVVLEDIEHPDVAEHVARKIIAAFGQPLELDGRSEVVISPSVGISLYPDHGLVPSDLLKFADTAMYQAKDHGRNTFQFYTEAMDAEARQRATMIAALRKALERGEFRLVYQPRMSLGDGCITGVEALLRWYSEDIGEVLPSTFIPLAEETGLILPIGEWVMREACLTLRRWEQSGLSDLGMAINVSVGQFLRGRLPQLLGDLIEELDLQSGNVELEVTESMVMANAEQATTVLHELRRLGVTLAIDDFGTGYSSLVYLKRLPIDTLKIDKEFIGDLTTDPDDEAITATVITMAHSLGLNVVAEGVENAEQLDYLRQQRCDEIQGYWLSPPLEVHHCLAFIRQHQPERFVERERSASSDGASNETAAGSG
ncbi:MAG: EAL domain-containing protein [Xanthomonadales bacterium]|nr:EAL domain-containing protein [Xanthomonadales bacterium]